eukprot:1159410-Pelagomonas_calceolata.AAC.2
MGSVSIPDTFIITPLITPALVMPCACSSHSLTTCGISPMKVSCFFPSNQSSIGHEAQTASYAVPSVGREGPFANQPAERAPPRRPLEGHQWAT